jgi:hypothetical protein
VPLAIQKYYGSGVYESMEMSHQMIKKTTLFSLICVVVVIVSYVFVLAPFKVNKNARYEILTIYHTVLLGMSKDEVLQKYKTGGFLDVKLDEHKINQWILSTPVEFGAQNWILYINFEKERVIRLEIRSHDNSSRKPKDAPDDKY